MIAGGNHSTVKRWLSVSETGGVLYVNRAVQETPQSARSGCQLPFQGNVINLRALFQHAQKLVIEFIDNASAR